MITTEKEYYILTKRIDELLKVVNNSTPMDDSNFIELNNISDLVAEYEEQNLHIEKPHLVDVIKLRMYERGLKQKDLAELLETTSSRISEYLKGKRELTFGMAKKLHKKLNIYPDIILQ